MVGKSTAETAKLFDDYLNRIQRYVPTECVIVPAKQRDEEGRQIERLLRPDDFVVLLDDKGQQLTSLQFAQWTKQRLMSGKRIVLVLGGAYGFAQCAYDHANALLSLSPMTLPHLLARIVLIEQLYRALTIIRGESYHHEESLLKK